MKVLLGVVLAFVLVVSFYVRMLNFGWVLLAYGIVYTVLALAGHMFVHYRILRLRDKDAFHGALLVTILVSHALFLGAFLLQYDSVEYGGLVIERLFGRQSYWLTPFREAHTWNIAMFIPVCVSWIVVLKRLRTH